MQQGGGAAQGIEPAVRPRCGHGLGTDTLLPLTALNREFHTVVPGDSVGTPFFRSRDLQEKNPNRFLLSCLQFESRHGSAYR